MAKLEEDEMTLCLNCGSDMHFGELTFCKTYDVVRKYKKSIRCGMLTCKRCKYCKYCTEKIGEFKKGKEFTYENSLNEHMLEENFGFKVLHPIG